MTVEFDVAEMFHDIIYSWDTWATILKFLIPFAVAALVLSTLKALLNALARFIKRKRH